MHQISSLISQGSIKMIGQIRHITILASSSRSSIFPLQVTNYKLFNPKVWLNEHSGDIYLSASHLL